MRVVDGENSILSIEESAKAEVLIEKLPIKYDLKNIEKSKWQNITELETIIFGKYRCKRLQPPSCLGGCIAKYIYVSSFV